MKLIGIYKITSPTGRVYIGQSRDIEGRFNQHRRKNRLRPTLVTRSIVKHSAENHLFEIVYPLPVDVTSEILNTYELLFIDQHRECGFRMMNLGECNIGGTITEETRKRLSESHKGQPAFWKGKKMPDWLKQKFSNAQSGKKQKPEHIEQRRRSNTGKKRTEETKAKLRIACKGKTGYKKGTRKCSEETKRKISQSNMGRIISQETRIKIRNTLLKRNNDNCSN